MGPLNGAPTDDVSPSAPFIGDVAGALPFTLDAPPNVLAFESLGMLVPFAGLLVVLLLGLMLLVLFGGGGSGNDPLLLDSGRGGAPLVRLVLLPLLVVPLDTATGGYGRLGGGRAAGAGDGAGAAVPGTGTGLALPVMPRGPLLSGGRPVGGNSDFLGADGLPPGNDDASVVVVAAAAAAAPCAVLLPLEVVIASADVDAGKTPTELLPSDACNEGEENEEGLQLTQCPRIIW